MSSRLVKALSVGDLRVTNREPVSVGIEFVSEKDGTRTKSVRIFRPGREINLTRLYSVQDLRKSPHLKRVVSTRAILIKDTWSDK